MVVQEARSKLEAVMLERKLTQADLRRLTGLPKETISRAVRGKGGQHVRTIQTIAAAIGVPVDSILQG